jgi:hypothetical protein
LILVLKFFNIAFWLYIANPEKKKKKKKRLTAARTLLLLLLDDNEESQAASKQASTQSTVGMVMTHEEHLNILLTCIQCCFLLCPCGFLI